MNALRYVLLVTISFVLVGPLLAQTPAQERPAAESVEAMVESLIGQLDSPRFSERARAMTDLQRLGHAAIKPLEQVVLGGTAEAAQRALDILKRNFKSDDQGRSSAASEALRRIAQKENHPFAPKAQLILTPPQPKPQPPRIRAPQLPQLNPPVRMQIQVQMKSVNGRKEVTIKENGREFKFNEDEGGITVQRPDDKGGVKKTVYKNKDELKKKDPEAFGKYERYAGKGMGINIQMGGGFKGGIPQFQIRPQLQPPPPVIPEIRRPKPLRPIPERRKPEPKLDDTIEV